MNNDKSWQEYLLSEEWQKRRRLRMQIDSYTCQGCGNRLSAKELQVHHLTYENARNENVYKDLVSVCKKCHDLVHRVYSRVQDADGNRGWQGHQYNDTKEQ